MRNANGNASSEAHSISVTSTEFVVGGCPKVPPSGSAVLGTPVSFARICCVLRASVTACCTSSFPAPLRLILGRIFPATRRASSPLAIGTIELEDGRNVHGFVCESHAVAGSREISEFGGLASSMPVYALRFHCPVRRLASAAGMCRAVASTLARYSASLGTLRSGIAGAIPW